MGLKLQKDRCMGALWEKTGNFLERSYLCQDIIDKGFLPQLEDSNMKIKKMLEELKTIRDSSLESVLFFIGGNSVITKSNKKICFGRPYLLLLKQNKCKMICIWHLTLVWNLYIVIFCGKRLWILSFPWQCTHSRKATIKFLFKWKLNIMKDIIYVLFYIHT